MAKKQSVRKLTADQAAVPTSQPLSDIERKELATASAAAQPDAEKRQPLTPEAKKLWDSNRLGIQMPALYGSRDSRPFGWRDIVARSNFLDRTLDVPDIEEMHSLDPSAPSEPVCGYCQQPVGAPIVRSALVKSNGDLIRDKDENVVYRGQAVVVGSPMVVQPGHAGNCLFQLRDARKRTKKLDNGRTVRDLLPSQAFDQAKARLAGITASQTARREHDEGFRQRIGFAGKGGGNFNNPHLATAGRQSRRNVDPRERNIGNRG